MHCSKIYNYTARNRKECTLCGKEVVSISDHLNWTHHITNDVERRALCREASDKLVSIKNMTYTLTYILSDSARKAEKTEVSEEGKSSR